MFNVKIDFYISPQTLDQYWTTLVKLIKAKGVLGFCLFFIYFLSKAML